jgi:methyl-accepting chemotaxis protein
MNVFIVFVAMLVVVLTSVIGMRIIRINIDKLTRQTTPYQIKALNQQRILQMHATNLLSLSSAITSSDYKRITPIVEVSLEEVSKANDIMAKISGKRVENDAVISDITKQIIKSTGQRLSSEAEVNAAVKVILGYSGAASARVAALDSLIRKLQNTASTTMAGNINSVVGANQNNTSIFGVRDALEEYIFQIQKLQNVANNRALGGVREAIAAALEDVTTALRDVSGMDEAKAEMTKRLKIVNERAIGTGGLADLREAAIDAEVEGSANSQVSEIEKTKIPQTIKDIQDGLQLVSMLVNKQVSQSNALLRNNTESLSKEVGTFANTNTILMLASALSLTNKSIESQINYSIGVQSLPEFEQVRSELENAFAISYATARNLKQQLRGGNYVQEIGLLDAYLSMVAAVHDQFFGSGGGADKLAENLQLKADVVQLNAKMKVVVDEQLGASNKEVVKAGSFQEEAIITVYRVSNATMTMICLIGLLAIIIITILGRRIIESITKPLSLLVTTVEMVEQSGEFSHRIEVTNDDEVGHAAKAFNSMLATLQGAIGDINQVMYKVSYGDFSAQVETELKGDLFVLQSSINNTVLQLKQTMGVLNEVLQSLVDGVFDQEVEANVSGEFLDSVNKAKVSMEALNQIITSINDVMYAVVKGDLTRRVDIDASGQLETLKTNINQSMEALAHTVSMTKSLVQNVATSGTEAMSAVEIVHEGSQTQLEAMKMISSVIQQTVESVVHITGNTDKASENARESSAMVLQSQTGMENLKDVMTRISESSQQINKITDVIAEIANQTNLLSLNAAIEAARAGEHGKGFAVVAEEVRKLADHSANSVQEISQLVTSAVKETKQGVETTEKVVKNMAVLAHKVKDTDEMLHDIAATMEETSASMEEVNASVADLRHVSETNFEVADRISKNIGELSGLADDSHRQLSKFTV